jgi:anti-sigma factor RsiW
VKQNRFIELLNLYVDHQIAPGEAAELEAEILRNPERRKTYLDYCRMQRACGMIFARESERAPASFALEKSLQETERKIIDFPARRKAGWGTYTVAFGGLTAMAACVAFVLLGSGTAPAPDAKTTVASVTAEKTSASLPVVAMSPRSSTFEPVFASQNLMVVRDDTVLPERAAGTEWMQQVQLPQVQRVIVDDSAFEARPTLQQDNSRVFRSGRPIQGNVEFTAFQFQR